MNVRSNMLSSDYSFVATGKGSIAMSRIERAGTSNKELALVGQVCTEQLHLIIQLCMATPLAKPAKIGSW